MVHCLEPLQLGTGPVPPDDSPPSNNPKRYRNEHCKEHFIPTHPTKQHSTAQHSTAQHSTAQHSTVQGRRGLTCDGVRRGAQPRIVGVLLRGVLAGGTTSRGGLLGERVHAPQTTSCMPRRRGPPPVSTAWGAAQWSPI